MPFFVNPDTTCAPGRLLGSAASLVESLCRDSSSLGCSRFRGLNPLLLVPVHETWNPVQETSPTDI
jgi:hypothetical protein